MGDDLGEDDFLDLNSRLGNNDESDNEATDDIPMKSKKRVQEQEKNVIDDEEAEDKPKKKKKKKAKAEVVAQSSDVHLSLEERVGQITELYRNELALKFVPAELNVGAKLTLSYLVEVPKQILQANGKSQLDLLPGFIRSCITPTSQGNGNNKKNGGTSNNEKNNVILPGHPQVIVICASALRCCAMVPTLRKSSNMLGRTADHVAKLFAKHQKVPEQVKELKKLASRVVVGTPNRIHRLFDEKALSLDNCELILLDVSEKDSKNYSLLTLPGVKTDLMLLFKEHLLPGVAQTANEKIRAKFAFL